MSNSDIITDFCATWAKKDLEALMEFFTDDAIYHNIPMDPPAVGTDEIRAIIDSFTSAPETVEFVVHNQAENAEGVVMNERTDNFLIGESTISLRVMGTFELENGKIKHWRDYFDINQYMAQLPQ